MIIDTAFWNAEDTKNYDQKNVIFTSDLSERRAVGDIVAHVNNSRLIKVGIVYALNSKGEPRIDWTNDNIDKLIVINVPTKLKRTTLQALEGTELYSEIFKARNRFMR